MSSCSGYNKILSNPDPEYRYTQAKKYFDEGKFSRSATLLEDLVPVFKGTSYAEEALYLLARSYYGMKDYTTASQYFTTYYTTYTKGQYAELSRFYAAYGLYKESPDPRLDQTNTHKAMQQFQEFLEYFPQSERKDEAQSILFELQEKLAYKELLAVRLYYNLGNYVVGYPFPGGNYASSVITAENALKMYPFSYYKEDFMYYVIMSKYAMAEQSVEDKKDSRFRDVIDEYYSYMNEFPGGKYLKQVQKIYENSQKKIKGNQI